MAALTFPRLPKFSHSTARHLAPFYSRAYGGYTADQLRFALTGLPAVAEQVILDPMAGQGYYLAQLAWQGARVYLGDFNPATLLLAALRDPDLLVRANDLLPGYLATLGKIPASRSLQSLEYTEGWLSDTIRTQLDAYARVFQLPALGNPLRPDSAFWDAPITLRLAAALPILAARELAAFTRTDNATWLKNGGLQRITDIRQILSNAVTTWAEYANWIVGHCSIDALSSGVLHVNVMDTQHGVFGDVPLPTVIITSPPYANRLDYTRLWGPELAVAAALYPDIDSRVLQAKQIGSNVVTGKTIEYELVQRPPASVQDALELIRTDSTPLRARATYYYPFFCQYAIAMASALRNMCDLVPESGRIALFVRDTVIKDVLFPTGMLIQQIVVSHAGFNQIDMERRIVRRHIGLRRSKRRTGLYGIGQQEWWFCFERKAA